MKKLTIVVVIWLMFMTTQLMAQDSVNWASRPDSVKSKNVNPSYSGGGDVFNIGDVFDNNEATSMYITLSPAYGDATTITVESDFAIPRTINQLKFICSATWITQIHNIGVSCGNNYTLEAFYDGIWQVVGSGSLSYGTLTTIDFPNLQLIGVSKVKFAIGASGSFLGSPFLGFNFTAYEFYAFGPDYIDIGLRCYNSAGAVSIACHPAGELLTPLRLHKNGTVYSVALVDASNINASKIRIKTQSGIKSFAKFN